MKKVFKTYILTAFLTTLVFAVTMVALRLHPFGEGSLLVWDGNDQYLNFYGHLQSILRGRAETIFYSFSNVLGGNMYSLAAYYLFSPFFLLFAFFPKEQLIFAVHIVAWLKYLLSALAFCVYLNGRYENRTVEKSIFSVCYSFIGYTVAYFMILPWIDGVLLLPLIAHGIHKMVLKKQCGLYTLSLAAAIISNYYIGYMLCIASVLFYLAEIIVSEGGIKASLKESWYRFGLSSLLSGGLGAFVLLPVLKDIRGERLEFGLSELIRFHFNFEFVEVFTKLFTGSTDGRQVKNGLPILFFGIVPLVLVCLFFLNKEIKYVYKVTVALLLLAFLLFFQNSTLNIFWHGMTDNNCFNYRYSFVFSFICLIAAFSALCHIDRLRLEDFGKCGWIFFLFIVIVFNEQREYITPWILYLDIFWIVAGLIFLACSNHGIQPRYYYTVLVLLLMLNVLENNVITIKRIMLSFDSAAQTEYSAFYREVSGLMEKIPKEQLVRTEKNFHRTSCDNMLLGIKGVSNFASTENMDTIKFVKNIGMRYEEWKEGGYNEDCPASADSLLGIKYLLSDEALTDKDYVLMQRDQNYYIYQNPYSLPLLMPAESLINGISDDLDSFERMNLYWRSLDEDIEADVFERQGFLELPETTEIPEHLKGKVISKNGGVLYLYMPAGKYEVESKIDGKTTKIENSGKQVVYCIGKAEAGQEIELEIIGEEDVPLAKDQLSVYVENENVLSRYTEAINRMGITLYEKSSSHLEGYVTTDDEAQYIATSIPYDKGWNVYMDGQRVPVEKNWDTMLAFRAASKGNHVIVMKYYPEGWQTGIVITGISVLLFILCLLRNKMSKAV